MATVTAYIDISKPVGRKLVRELENHSKIVKLNYPEPDSVLVSGYTLEESYNLGINKLSELYGVDFREL
jgi:hypothetical protein